MSHRSAIASLAVVLALAILSGCGGSGDDEGEPTTGAFFGIAPAESPSDSDFARMAAGGIGSYHLQLAWLSVEGAEGNYNWDAYDVVFAQLARSGIEPVPYIVGTPPIYESVGSDPPTSSEETFDAWADFLEQAALRYGPDGIFWTDIFPAQDPRVEPQPIRTWEIWNEPNSSLFWTPSPDPGDYAELITRSSKVLKKVDPEAQIMSAGMFATPQSDGAIESPDFLREVLDEPGAAEAIDVVGVHPYGPDIESVVEQVDETRAVLDELDQDQPLWITEIGWASDPAPGADQSKTPEVQAELLTESLGTFYEQREELDLLGVIWFTWHDLDEGALGDCVWCATAGLVDTDRDSKPAWLAFTELTGGTP